MNLHGQIMNLTATEPVEYTDAAVRMAYRVGHRDARHAAAKLAQDADAEIEALRAIAAQHEWLLKTFSVMGANIDGSHSWVWRGSPDRMRGATMAEAINRAMFPVVDIDAIHKRSAP